MADARYGRQVRLAEVGAAGQTRLENARAVAASDIEATYLRAAGVQVIDRDEPGALHASDAETACTLEALGIRDDAARSVAEGALRALLVMREALKA